MMAIVRPTLARQAYEEIQKKILTGELPAGKRIFADELASELSISPTPVKEALALLERDGLVEGTERRASVVRRFTPADIREIYEARVLLELNAVRAGIAAGRLDDAFLHRMEAIYAAHVGLLDRAAGAAPVLAEVIGLDRDFHETIMTLGGNGLLSSWHQTILWQTQSIRTYSPETYDFERSRAEHEAILGAMRGRDPARIVAALTDHLEKSRDHLLIHAPGAAPSR
ncbi:GntR family transcriptional regulator [Chthonobacter rhizosphaerae]|uniref:GntR family transcriptional regulator n=1 Tax=Chthonobacter rhizosphaerae TaxID=2735553 RepID=UPI0015EF3920|nr:GntR family transcriptional regulator [Chthonobacter rhizosphaerae]